MTARGRTMHAVGARPDDSVRAVGRMTAGQRWRLRRDIVIYLAGSRGASHRMLGDVFDLPHSRVCQILKNMKARHEHPDRPAE